jgi:hypothetical protein
MITQNQKQTELIGEYVQNSNKSNLHELYILLNKI